MRLLLFCFLIITQSIFSQNKLEEEQAKIMYNTAQSYYENQFYKSAIETLTEYLFLYPNSEQKKEAYELLENAYKVRKEYENLKKLYLFQYTSSPFSDNGILAYFKLGQLYKQTDKIEKAKQIFTELNQTEYSFLIKQKAENELKKLNS